MSRLLTLELEDEVYLILQERAVMDNLSVDEGTANLLNDLVADYEERRQSCPV